MQACMLSQPALADWKAHSIYRGDQWKIGRIKRVPGDYAIKGRPDASLLSGRRLWTSRTPVRSSHRPRAGQKGVDSHLSNHHADN